MESINRKYTISHVDAKEDFESQNHEIDKIPPKELEDYLFNEYIKRVVMNSFWEDLEEFVSDKDIIEIKKASEEFSDSELISAMSLPHELRRRTFKKFEENLNEGATPKKLIENFIHTAMKYDFGIGYHASPMDIRPKGENEEWIINGTENDHRDNDLSRAYYSTKFKHLYKAKGLRGYIYVVRTNKEDKTDGNWGRAGTLSIITRLPYQEVFEYVTRTARKIREKPNEK